MGQNPDVLTGSSGGERFLPRCAAWRNFYCPKSVGDDRAAEAVSDFHFLDSNNEAVATASEWLLGTQRDQYLLLDSAVGVVDGRPGRALQIDGTRVLVHAKYQGLKVTAAIAGRVPIAVMVEGLLAPPTESTDQLPAIVYRLSVENLLSGVVDQEPELHLQPIDRAGPGAPGPSPIRVIV